MKKNLDISDKAVEILTIEAVKKKKVFKIFAQDILENEAKKIDSRKKEKK